MSNVKILTSMDILLFPVSEKNYTGCQLKTFLSFLIGQGAGPAPRFSFMDSEGSLLPKLTLKENIYLDSIPSSLTNSKEIQLQRFMQKTGNTHLINFYQSIPLLDELPTKVDDQTRKMAALVKTLLQDSDYLLLDHPEKYLSQKNLELLIRALEFYAASSNKMILLSSPAIDSWGPYVTKLVYRHPDKSFEIRPVVHTASTNSIKSKTKESLGHLSFRNFPEQEELPQNPKDNSKKAA